MREEHGSLGDGLESRIVLERTSILDGASAVNMHRREETTTGRCQLETADLKRAGERRTLALQSRRGRCTEVSVEVIKGRCLHLPERNFRVFGRENALCLWAVSTASLSVLLLKTYSFRSYVFLCRCS